MCLWTFGENSLPVDSAEACQIDTRAVMNSSPLTGLKRVHYKEKWIWSCITALALPWHVLNSA